MAASLRETDLYAPVRDLLIADGYAVRGEVRGCDVVGRRGDDVVVVELKRSFNATLLFQAVRRQRHADSVYVAIPRPPRLRGRDWQGLLLLVRRLELGLILVDPAGVVPAQIAVQPQPYQRRRQSAERRALISEFAGRSGDRNAGGSVRRPLVTAYREAALHLACCLEHSGPASPKLLRALGATPKAGPMLYQDVYGWFMRRGRGLYALGTGGRAALVEHAEIAALLRTRVAEAAEAVKAG